jgi:hypothetical protein
MNVSRGRAIYPSINLSIDKGLVGYCLNDACRYSALIDVSSYPDDVEVPSFQHRKNTASAVETDVGWTSGPTEGEAWHARQLGRALGLGEVMPRWRVQPCPLA